jgi:isoleucyl-tRNA synthetase
LVFDRSSYKTVLCLGHILDKDGRKMSKHLGNVLEPIPLMDQHGADAVRWYMLAAGSPWSARRVGHDAISDVVRKTLLTYWNTVSFLSLYARASEFSLPPSPSPIAQRPMMDRWIISELHQVIESVDSALENFDSQSAGKLLATFIDDLSNWYVRRSRRRFWDGDLMALETLYECLEKLTLLMSPLVPFITEHVWQELIRPVNSSAAESVHLADFPTVDKAVIDSALSSQVAQTRRLVELGRASRAESQVKIRQPLSRALIAAPGWTALDQQLKDQIADELNVLVLDDLASAGGGLVDVSLKANFRSLGARYGADVQAIARALSSVNPEELVQELRRQKVVEISYADSQGNSANAELTESDLVITETPREGWSVSSHSGESVALDLTLTPELIAAGYVREVIRAVQDERKRVGLEVTDRISLTWNAGDEVANAIASHSDEIAQEVLALSIVRDLALPLAENELQLTLKVSKSS